MKTSAIKSQSHRIILNDKEATDSSIDEFGWHGVMLCLVDVDFNDMNRSFQTWHSELKGGLSPYEQERIARKATSRYRKTSAHVVQILLLLFNDNNLSCLDIHQQGRNSDGNQRRTKYMLDIEHADQFEVARIEF